MTVQWVVVDPFIIYTIFHRVTISIIIKYCFKSKPLNSYNLKMVNDLIKCLAKVKYNSKQNM